MSNKTKEEVKEQLAENMGVQDDDNSKKEQLEADLIAWRRTQVWELLTKGLSQTEIAKKLGVSDATIHRDIEHMRNETADKEEEISKEFSFEQQKAMQGISLAIRNMWTIADNEKGPASERMQALSMLIRAYELRLGVAAGKNIAKLLKGEASLLELMKQQKDIAAHEAYILASKLKQAKDKVEELECRFEIIMSRSRAESTEA